MNPCRKFEKLNLTRDNENPSYSLDLTAQVLVESWQSPKRDTIESSRRV